MTSDINFDRKCRRASALEKIRALLRKTVENGATEAEALAAAAKAEELIAKYDVETTELDIQESSFAEAKSGFNRDDYDFLVVVSNAIALFTETRFWTETRNMIPDKGVFFGLAHDVEIAEYFLAICMGAMQREVDRYARTEAVFFPRRKERMIRSFKEGMADRLGERFVMMASSRKKAGKGLIVLKDALIKEEISRSGGEFTDERLRYRDKDADSFNRGSAAGDRVALNEGLGGRDDAVKISG